MEINLASSGLVGPVEGAARVRACSGFVAARVRSCGGLGGAGASCNFADRELGGSWIESTEEHYEAKMA